MRFGKNILVLSNEQDVGQRDRQEDYFGFWFDENKRGDTVSSLIVLADGMGGLEGGDAASVIAINTFIDSMRNGDLSLPIAQQFEIAAQEANARVYEMADQAQKDIGSTLVALYLTPESYQWISIGDSLLFRFRNGKIERLNRDHNLGAQLDEQIEQGLITEDEAAQREDEREYLTSNLGLEEIPEMDLSISEPLLLNDRFVLSSDGLSNTLPLSRIEQIVMTCEPNDIAPQLVREAIQEQNPRQDNITIASVTIDKSSSISNKASFWGLVVFVLAILIFIILNMIRPSEIEQTTKAVSDAAVKTSSLKEIVDSGAITVDSGKTDAAQSKNKKGVNDKRKKAGMQTDGSI